MDRPDKPLDFDSLFNNEEKEKNKAIEPEDLDDIIKKIDSQRRAIAAARSKSDLQKPPIKGFAQSPSIQEDQPYHCSLCHDTGWIITADGALPCQCHKDDILKKRCLRAGITPVLRGKRFSNFNLEFYEETMSIEIEGKSIFINPRKIAETAYGAAKDFTSAQIKGQPCRGLLLEGAVGRGKSFLAAAIANQLVDCGIDVLFLIVPEFLDQLRFSYQKDEQSSEAELIRNVQTRRVLILDDLGSHNYSEWTKNKIFTLLNYRLNHGLPCIVTTNLSVEEMEAAIGRRSVSRLMEMCDYHFLYANKDFRYSEV